jgi:hypothetical protein
MVLRKSKISCFNTGLWTVKFSDVLKYSCTEEWFLYTDVQYR